MLNKTIYANFRQIFSSITIGRIASKYNKNNKQNNNSRDQIAIKPCRAHTSATLATTIKCCNVLRMNYNGTKNVKHF